MSDNDATTPDINLPRDTEGDIVTSAQFGETWLVRIFYNTDPEGTWVEEGDWTNVTLHGEFSSSEEAEAWLEAYPDGDKDVKDMDIILVNRVRPATDHGLVVLARMAADTSGHPLSGNERTFLAEFCAKHGITAEDGVVL
jgi:hypothetical protein